MCTRVGPKKTAEPDGGELIDALNEIEIYIKDYIVMGDSVDPILDHYIILARTQEKLGTPVFSCGLLDRPAMWERSIRPWILEGFQELELIKPSD